MATFSRSASLEWTGDVPHGTGMVGAASGSFTIPASFPMTSGDPGSVTTPEELLAASHAVCYGIGLRSMIRRRGGTATRVVVRATVNAEKSAVGIRIRSADLRAFVEGLEGLSTTDLQEIAQTTEDGCTISNAIRSSVMITHEVMEVEDATEYLRTRTQPALEGGADGDVPTMQPGIRSAET